MTKTIWLSEPKDRRGDVVDILPRDFDTAEDPCTYCGGTLDTGWECNRCGLDHYPAVKRMKDV